MELAALPPPLRPKAQTALGFPQPRRAPRAGPGGHTHHPLKGGWDEATVHGDERAADVGLQGRAGGVSSGLGSTLLPTAPPTGPTWMSSSLESKWVMMTFSPSDTRVREMPRRPLARSWLSAGSVFSRQPRMIFTKLKEGCRGPRNLFRASLDTSMILAPASPGAAGPRSEPVLLH